MNMNLRNPFAIRGNKVVMIEDICRKMYYYFLLFDISYKTPCIYCQNMI